MRNIVRAGLVERAMIKDSDFGSAFIKTLFDAQDYFIYNNPGKSCPLTKEAIVYLSKYLRAQYSQKEKDMFVALRDDEPLPKRKSYHKIIIINQLTLF